MAHRIAVLSQKGGTGKTTTVRTLADAFRRVGLRVLAIDLDPQGNLSDYFDLPPDAQPTIADVLQGRVVAAGAVHDGVIPANLQLAEAELALAGKMGRELSLRKVLRDSDDELDVVLLDCPPNLGLLTVNALVASSHALIACEAQYFALQGVEQALQVIELARDGLNPDLDWLGTVVTKADLRTVHSREAVEQLREAHPDKVLDTVIRSSIAYAESAERAVSILDHRPELGADYLDLAAEICDRLGEDPSRRRLQRMAKAARS
ncbi:Chromosome (plasmid) partitioning protein ParA [Patulibacter medicamentivorans]|uniref:Chromosome (Plasmid) partitioning protein ParA n=1 Tax=Patulibacter medicamentivorans TaxID=1097667 RepID=H0EC22_9ACTN|nr:ParA family protein [Patulibacter medicamentivorans]EHN08775.1 Chromosome (plasmid) partitioning protein ParA [Patulibacter medicamentivorans]